MNKNEDLSLNYFQKAIELHNENNLRDYDHANKEKALKMKLDAIKRKKQLNNTYKSINNSFTESTLIFELTPSSDFISETGMNLISKKNKFFSFL